MFYRRRLPHWIPENAIVFLTWRLAGSTPPPVPEILNRQNNEYEKRYSRSGSGPLWLQEERIATMLVNALHYGEATRQFYRLYAWVIMPNHVHVILEPRIELPSLMRWLKGRTSRMANRLLGRTGAPFWQDESFDHWIRSREELQKLVEYVEGNPVKAGLVQVAEQWPWSSARLKADDTNRSSAPPLLIKNFSAQG
jgi:REP element-mobilizing transposase RayT